MNFALWWARRQQVPFQWNVEWLNAGIWQSRLKLYICPKGITWFSVTINYYVLHSTLLVIDNKPKKTVSQTKKQKKGSWQHENDIMVFFSPWIFLMEDYNHLSKSNVKLAQNFAFCSKCLMTRNCLIGKCPNNNYLKSLRQHHTGQWHWIKLNFWFQGM